MSFTPYYTHIEVVPAKQESEIYSENEQYSQMGEVVSVGRDVDFVKPGDTLFFEAHGCWETPEVDGMKHWVVPQESEFILGKIENVAEE